jgi:hypothetical protein
MTGEMNSELLRLLEATEGDDVCGFFFVDVRRVVL